MNLKIEKKSFPSVYYAYVRHVGSYSECKSSWKEVIDWSIKNQIPHEGAIFFGIGYDNPAETKDCRYDACISIDRHFVDKFQTNTSLLGNIKIEKVSIGECATTIVNGSYEHLPEIYNELYNGKSLKKYKIDYTKPCIEVYINNPETTVVESLLTEIYIPIQ